MPDLAYVPADGYSCAGYLREQPGLHPEIHFVYRPLTALKVARVQNVVDRKKDRDQEYRTHAETLVDQKHLVEWDVKDQRGNVIPITVDNFLSLKDTVFVAMVAIMYGRAASDIEDGMRGNAPVDRDELAYIAGDDGAAGADEKNSETG